MVVKGFPRSKSALVIIKRRRDARKRRCGAQTGGEAVLVKPVVCPCACEDTVAPALRPGRLIPRRLGVELPEFVLGAYGVGGEDWSVSRCSGLGRAWGRVGRAG